MISEQPVERIKPLEVYDVLPALEEQYARMRKFACACINFPGHRDRNSKRSYGPQNCTWNVVNSPDGGSSSNFLYGVAATSTKNVWSTGFYYSMPGNVPAQTLTEHWNGSSWKIVASPNVGPGNSDLYGVANAPGSKQVWATGVDNNSSGVPQTLSESHC